MEESIGHPFTIYPDYDTFKFPTDKEVKFLGGNVGCFKHYYRTLKDLCDSDADIVGCFSDDVLYRKGWLDIAVKRLNKDVGFVSCYVPRGLQERNGWRKGWHELKGGWASSYGGGYLMRKDVALKILEHPFMINHLNNYKANQQVDHALPTVVHKMGLKQMFYVPSLMKHIGFHSTIGHTHTGNEDVLGW